MVVTQARDGGHGRSPAAVMTSAPPAPPPGKPSAGPAPVPSGSEAVPARTSRPAAPPVRLRDDTCREGLCPKYQRAMALLGKRWTWLVLRVLLDGPSRFCDFLARIEGISDPILSERLKELEAQGLIRRRVFQEMPVRVEYALTPKGEALREVLLLLHRWADTWETDDDHSPCDEC
jgi:DNA-binding HxlR family transcriptional regulator